MKGLIILNDPSYGTEHCSNGLQLASARIKNDPDGQITVFLIW